jgi:cell division protein FtsW
MGQQSTLGSDVLRGIKGIGGGKKVIRLKYDVFLTLVTITLVIYGSIIVYSASWDFSFLTYGSPTYILTRQLTFLAAGIVIMVALIFFDYHYWIRFATWLMLGTIGLLFVVLLIGEVRHGATRSLSQGSYQPSELAKIVTVLYLAVWLYSKRDQLSDTSFGLIPLAAILGIVGGLIIVQPDISAAGTVIILGGILFFLAGGDWKQIIALVILALLIGWIIVEINPTGSDRVTSYVAGLKDPTESSYHVRRSLEAFVRGGWFGVGIGRGTTKVTGLPFPHTDSVYAVVGEEFGWFGASVLVVLYAAIVWRGLEIARRAPDMFGKLLAAGLSMWIALEAFINMAAMVGVLPFAGNTLPFISAGGSNLLVSLAGIGILLNISRLSEEEKQKTERRPLSEVIDLRGRNGRRSVSGSRRSAKRGAK